MLKRKYRVLLGVASCEGLTVMDIAIKAGYEENAAAAKACLELYKNGYLYRVEVPKNSGSGGHKYEYYLTNKGSAKVKWIREKWHHLL